MVTRRLILALVVLFGCPSGLALCDPAGGRATASASDATTEMLRGGCWSSDPSADRAGASATYCFDPAGYLSGASIAYGTGGDFCVRWAARGPQTLLLYFSPEPDACGFAADPTGRSFDLTHCREAAHFRRDPQFSLTDWPCDAANLDF